VEEEIDLVEEVETVSHEGSEDRGVGEKLGVPYSSSLSLKTFTFWGRKMPHILEAMPPTITH